jgi:hypothetical protein
MAVVKARDARPVIQSWEVVCANVQINNHTGRQRVVPFAARSLPMP